MTVSYDMDQLLKEIEKLAKDAGSIILDGSDVKIKEKTGRRDLVTSKDLEIQDMLMEKLHALVPEARFFCEEDTSFDSRHVITDPEEIGEGICFIIDPIDGTSNFVHGQMHSCTSIAMAVDEIIEIGVIYDPFRRELFSACRGKGSFINGEKIPVFDEQLSDTIAVFGVETFILGDDKRILNCTVHAEAELIA